MKCSAGANPFAKCYIIEMWTLLVLTITALLFGQFILAVAIISRSSVAAAASVTPTNAEQLPDMARRYIGNTVQALRQDGFEVFSNQHDQHTVRSAEGFAVDLINRVQRDLATIMVAGRGRVWEAGVVFRTYVPDGREIATVNTRTRATLPPHPAITAVALPTITDPRQLYVAHRKRVSVLLPPNAVALLPEAGDEGNFIIREKQKYMRWFGESGYYRLDETSNVYRPTTRGTFLTATKIAWPFKLIWKWIHWRRERATIAEFGLSDLVQRSQALGKL